LGQRLPDILSLLSDLTQARSGLEYLQVALRYLTVVTDRCAVEQAFSPTGGALMATIAQSRAQLVAIEFAAMILFSRQAITAND